jgi:hypothetical protein
MNSQRRRQIERCDCEIARCIRDAMRDMPGEEDHPSGALLGLMEWSEEKRILESQC